MAPELKFARHACVAYTAGLDCGADAADRVLGQNYSAVRARAESLDVYLSGDRLATKYDGHSAAIHFRRPHTAPWHLRRDGDVLLVRCRALDVDDRPIPQRRSARR